LAALDVLLHPLLVVGGDLYQMVFVDREEAPVLTEEPHGPRSVQEGRNAGVQQNAVETRIVHGNAILVMFVKGVHRYPPSSLPGSLCDGRLDRTTRDTKGEALD